VHSAAHRYEKEGIPWIPVDYFDNHVLCEFIESTTKPMGMLTVLDDICLGPGEKTDDFFLEELNRHYVKSSVHFASWQNNKVVERDQFVVKHYAGDVAYTVDGFVDANNDLLFRDLKVAMVHSVNTIIAASFQASELESRKRPVTAGTQFRKNMNDLMATLMVKMPSYVRCIKPNGEKKANCWDPAVVEHQVKYLGLMENLRVARAGYCYRRPFADFLERYKSLCPETWPNYNGSPMNGVKILTAHLAAAESPEAKVLKTVWNKPTHNLGLGDGECAVGRSKVFIRSPKSVTAIEMAFQHHKNHLATRVIAVWKGKKQRRIYLRILAQRKIAAHWRG
jgi:myosin-1